MAATAQAPGWTSQFRELVLDVEARLHDVRGGRQEFSRLLGPEDYTAAQALAFSLRAAGSEGIAYPSVRDRGSECVGLFYPDLARNVRQGRHLDYHWDGRRVDLVREPGTPPRIFRVG
jgi:hypothetical protein